MDINSFLFMGAHLLFFFSGFSSSADTLTQNQSISVGGTLVSRDGSFELGFFNPGSSTNYYLGIWYKNIPVRTVVWVANRLNPIKDSPGMLLLMINSSATLVLHSHNGSVVWSAHSTKQTRNPLVLQLLDSGNLVLRGENDENSENYLWQSFDYPSDTLLPGMKFGWDLRAGLNRSLTAWKNWDDPSPGDFTFGIELHSYPEGIIKKGSTKYSRTGPWNGLHFSGAPALKTNQVFKFDFVSNKDEVYYIFYLNNKSVISRIVMNQTIYSLGRYAWSEENKTWSVYTEVPSDNCDKYNLCGAYGNCNIGEAPNCQCLKGFKSKSAEPWNPLGCVRSTQLSCQDKDKDGFRKYVGLKLPDTTYTWVNQSINLKECRLKCLNNCSCMAYTNSDVRGGGSGCAIWYGDLIDIRKLSVGDQDLYIRMPASELEAEDDPSKRKIAVIVATTLAAVVSGILLVGFYICRSRTNLEEVRTERNGVTGDQNNEGPREDMDLPIFDLSTIANATDNFSINNKLGEGGFGPVYKGILVDGHEIAVKRLSRSSRQGLNEFKNEVRLIAKLQHRNLVKLLGCCIQGEEKMLVYEYMPNNSLDTFIFDQKRGKLLDWPKRFHIIFGIARGLLYLHQDSRLRIIHRDLKASNVLLDSEMIPKISDFGMAKTFGGDQTEGNTNRVVGTYGYMAPEYAFDGVFSIKSDVFSFGILMLEIISGKKSRGFYHQNRSQNLIGHAWKLWKEGKPLELIDECLEDSCTLPDVFRCIHLSLLCLQQRPDDRPSMSSVVVMLSSESELPQPKEFGFLLERDSHEAHSSSNKHESSSTNEITITQLEAR